MTTTDSRGIVYLEDTDLISPLHTTLNTLQSGTSAAIGALQTTVNSSLSFPWAAYSPTWSNISFGSGSATSRWVKIGRTVRVMTRVTLGSGFALNSGLVTLSLPTPVSGAWTGDTPIGLVAITDVGSGYYDSWVRLQGSVAALHDVYAGKFGWAAGDKFSATFSYESAT